MAKYVPLDVRTVPGYDADCPPDLFALLDEFIRRGPEEMWDVLHPDPRQSTWIDGEIRGFPHPEDDEPVDAPLNLWVPEGSLIIGTGHRYFEEFRKGAAGQLTPNEAPVIALAGVDHLRRLLRDSPPDVQELFDPARGDEYAGGVVSFRHKQDGPVRLPKELLERLGLKGFDSLPLREGPGTQLDIDVAFWMIARRLPGLGLRVVGRIALGLGRPVSESLAEQWQLQGEGQPGYVRPMEPEVAAGHIIEATPDA